VHLLHSQRTDGGDKAGLVGLSLTERKAPTRTAREISADMGGSRIEFTQTGDRTDRGDLHAADAVIDAWSYR